MDDYRIEKVESKNCQYSFIYGLWIIAVDNDYVFSIDKWINISANCFWRFSTTFIS